MSLKRYFLVFFFFWIVADDANLVLEALAKVIMSTKIKVNVEKMSNDGLFGVICCLCVI
jgi:hypothetical protein